MAYQNTDILSRLSEVLSTKYGHLGCDQPVNIPLWDQDGLWASFLGLFGRAPQVSLTVRYSTESGYTLDGPAWRDIKSRLNVGAKEFGIRIISELRDLWEVTHGWEAALLEDLAELDEL